jgi:UDP-glucose:(heptosyl)LPS alpha-1,3-glucosyltransferase
VGSEWTGKGLAIAIESVAKAPPWNLTVVGRGDVARYEQLARRLGAGRRVHFVGEVEDVAPYYAEAHAFLFPTAYETFSLVTYEAAAAGLPLLAPRVSGIEDLIVDGRNGYFIERNPDDASEKLLRLLDPSVRHALGAAAAQAAKGFTWERMIDDFDRVLGKLARGERE